MYHLRFVYGCNPAVETAFFDLKSQMEKKSLDSFLKGWMSPAPGSAGLPSGWFPAALTHQHQKAMMIIIIKSYYLEWWWFCPLHLGPGLPWCSDSPNRRRSSPRGNEERQGETLPVEEATSRARNVRWPDVGPDLSLVWMWQLHAFGWQRVYFDILIWEQLYWA